MKMLKLVDLIRLSGIELGDYKIHCATDNNRSGWRPLEEYFAGTFEVGQSHQAQKNFECENVLSLINLGNSKRWLFVGVYHVDGVREIQIKEWSGFFYTLTPIAGPEQLAGRAIIDFPKTFRASYLVGKKYEDQLFISSIREEKMSIADFPGFNSVRLSYKMLKSIVREDNPSWKSALANVAGVYIITDAATGRQYVGSAYGGIGLWQRWSAYADSGHGHNKELVELISAKGNEYAKNFQFSIIEVCDINSNPDHVISRESHWKDVLMTREFGLNRN
ncbi:MAG: GIY-YIG nuclease family protein [Pirellulales bacterium]|nr:GIY-YIG nuclease family protein [Pirellulales bacterium]